MAVKLNYFGTDLGTPGHYFFEISEQGFGRSQVRFEKLPFNPEALPYKPKFDKGERKDYHAFGFTILAISGSVADSRGGCKSIFFVEEEISFEQMEKLVRSTRFGSIVLNKLLANT